MLHSRFIAIAVNDPHNSPVAQIAQLFLALGVVADVDHRPVVLDFSRGEDRALETETTLVAIDQAINHTFEIWSSPDNNDRVNFFPIP
jgi:hypothetical protein